MRVCACARVRVFSAGKCLLLCYHNNIHSLTHSDSSYCKTTHSRGVTHITLNGDERLDTRCQVLRIRFLLYLAAADTARTCCSLMIHGAMMNVDVLPPPMLSANLKRSLLECRSKPEKSKNKAVICCLVLKLLFTKITNTLRIYAAQYSFTYAS